MLLDSVAVRSLLRRDPQFVFRLCAVAGVFLRSRDLALALARGELFCR